jgi:hypothetical protein
VKARTVFIVALTAALASSGCGYRIVRNNNVAAVRFARDSATISSLRQQLAALKIQSRADSVRLEDQLAAQRAAAAVVPAPPPSDTLLKARTAEVAALKDQLAKVNAELDRIKRRLANPRG